MLEKFKSLFYHFRYLFPLQPNDNQSIWAKVFSYEMDCRQMRKLEEIHDLLKDKYFYQLPTYAWTA